jgi:hypothetical protein
MAMVATHDGLDAPRQGQKHIYMPTLLAFVDFRKAFDCVPHSALLAKAEAKGVRGAALNFLKVVYEEPTFRVRVGEALTEPITMQQGTRQGDPLSPIMFNLYIDDILGWGSPVGGPRNEG